MITSSLSLRRHAATLLLALVVALVAVAGSLTAPAAAAAPAVSPRATKCPLMANLTIPSKNPRNACGSIRHARSRSNYPADSCLNFVAQMYGWGNTGWSSPVAMWRNIRPALRHRNSTPPAGALAIWKTSNPLGHIALVTKNGVISTDVPRRGRVNEVRLHWITKNWNANYLGWVMPHFPTAS